MENVDAQASFGRSRKSDYVIAIAAAAVATLLVRGLSSYLPSSDQPAPISVSLFLFAILLSAWRGICPALLALVLSLLAQYCLFRPSSAGFLIAPRDQIRLICFAMIGLGIIALGAAKKAALTAAWSANADLARALLALKQTNQSLESESAERELVYKKLQFSEALLAEGQRISHTGSWLFNIEANKLRWSDEHYRIFGYEPDVGQPTFEMTSQRFHADDRHRVSHIVNDAVKAGARFECEYRIVLPEGTVRHILAIGYQANADHAGAGDYIGISVDITERRKTEELLRKREREFRTLAENSPDSVIRYDLDCQRVYVNPAYERTRAVEPGAMLHQPLARDWHWDTPVHEYEQRLRRIIATGQPEQMFGIWNIPNGKQIHCAIHAVAERDANGAVMSVLAIIRDISSIKQAELRLQESQILLRQLVNRTETVREEERKHLARELHDDLAQYLFTLRMSIMTVDFEFGQRHPSLAEKTGAMIALVDSGIKVVRNIVSSLRPAALDMGIVAALEWLVQEFSAQSGIVCHLQTAVAEDSPSEEHAVAFFRITQEALRNVARHAGATEVKIDFKRSNGAHQLVVEDNGTGFDPAHKKPSSFGLVGMRERALMYGGKVDIAAAPRRGTTIRVCIPFPAETADT
jgi:PAS domain S-box-containing protein